MPPKKKQPKQKPPVGDITRGVERIEKENQMSKELTKKPKRTLQDEIASVRKRNAPAGQVRSPQKKVMTKEKKK